MQSLMRAAMRGPSTHRSCMSLLRACTSTTQAPKASTAQRQAGDDYNPLEFVPHFSDKHEAPMEQVEKDFTEGYLDEETMKLKMRPKAKRKVPQLEELSVINEEAKSVYPIAKALREKNVRGESEYNYQQRVYQKQLKQLRHKWSMEHIMQKETKQKLANRKAEAEQLLMERRRNTQKMDVETRMKARERKKERMTRHQANMEARKQKSIALKEKSFEDWKKAKAHVKAERVATINVLGRMSKEWITSDKQLVDRTRMAMTDVKSFDKNIVVPVRDNFNPNKAKQDRLLFQKLSVMM